MKKFAIYNKSSENMKECQTDSVDLIITSPPYNIGTAYSENPDDSLFLDYIEMMENVIRECLRVVKPEGKIIIEAADSISSKDGYIQLAALIESIVARNGGFLIERHINFIKTENGIELPDHGWDGNFVTKGSAHSNCHHWLVFTKEKNNFKETGDVHYLDYLESGEHPCPFPDQISNLLLNKYYTMGQTVLDPFMGIAVLGCEVIRRKGFFCGYEIDPSIFENANTKLKIAQSSE